MPVEIIIFKHPIIIIIIIIISIIVNEIIIDFRKWTHTPPFITETSSRALIKELSEVPGIL